MKKLITYLTLVGGYFLLCGCNSSMASQISKQQLLPFFSEDTSYKKGDRVQHDIIITWTPSKDNNQTVSYRPGSLEAKRDIEPGPFNRDDWWGAKSPLEEPIPGVSLLTLTTEVRSEFGIPAETKGLVVSESTGKPGTFKKGIVIVEINGYKVNSTSVIREHLIMTGVNRFYVWYRGKYLFMNLNPAANYSSGPKQNFYWQSMGAGINPYQPMVDKALGTSD